MFTVAIGAFLGVFVMPLLIVAGIAPCVGGSRRLI